MAQWSPPTSIAAFPNILCTARNPSHSHYLNCCHSHMPWSLRTLLLQASKTVTKETPVLEYHAFCLLSFTNITSLLLELHSGLFFLKVLFQMIPLPQRDKLRPHQKQWPPGNLVTLSLFLYSMVTAIFASCIYCITIYHSLLRTGTHVHPTWGFTITSKTLKGALKYCKRPNESYESGC